MEDYKQRMVNEYFELIEKHKKLLSIIGEYYRNELDFKITCPITVLIAQSHIMQSYLDILSYRAELEHIELYGSEDN